MLRETIYVDQSSALELRDFRRRVRQVASLVTAGLGIGERPGEAWAADLETREIIWRATSPLPPHEPVTEEELLRVVTHEASHVRYTSPWMVPPGADSDRWFRFMNGLEDIRINRLAAREFKRFRSLCEEQYPRHIDWHRGQAHGYSKLDAVIYSWLAMELDEEPVGSDEARVFAAKTWPVVSRMCNACSTNELAALSEPVYWMLEDQQDEVQEDERLSELAGMVSDSDLDEPSSSPEKDDVAGEGAQSPGDHDDGVLLLMVAKDGNRGSTQAMTEELEAEADDRQDALVAMAILGEEGDVQPSDDDSDAWGLAHSDRVGSDDLWDRSRDKQRSAINVLARRLQAVLRHNEQDDWSRGRRRGQLDMGAAYRSLAGAVDVFRDRTELGAHDHAFAVLVDRSGSQMARIDKVLDAVVLVVEALDRAGLRTCVVPWDDQPYERKSFSEPLARHSAQLGARIGVAGGGTYEGAALVVAQDELARVRSRSRFLITVTDGRTARVHESEQLIEELEASNVRCMAVSIRHKEPAHYRESIRVDDVAELLEVLPRLIRQHVRRG